MNEPNKNTTLPEFLAGHLKAFEKARQEPDQTKSQSSNQKKDVTTKNVDKQKTQSKEKETELRKRNTLNK